MELVDGAPEFAEVTLTDTNQAHVEHRQDVELPPLSMPDIDALATAALHALDHALSTRALPARTQWMLSKTEAPAWERMTGTCGELEIWTIVPGPDAPGTDRSPDTLAAAAGAAVRVIAVLVRPPGSCDSLSCVSRPNAGPTTGGTMTTTRCALALATLILLAGCTGPGNPRFGDVPDDTVWNEPQEIQTPDTPANADPAPEVPSVWVCVYSPTYDDDWHNDVECSDGVNIDRPYLREWDDFVTEDEIMQSALEYEDALNAATVSAP